MPTLFRISDRIKGTIVLLAWIIAHLNRIAQAVVKIADDSEVTFAEAIGFVTSEGPVWVGEWKTRQTTPDPKSADHPSDASTAPPNATQAPRNRQATNFADALREDLKETLGDALEDAAEDTVARVVGFQGQGQGGKRIRS
jgi:hypothetical protein